MYREIKDGQTEWMNGQGWSDCHRIPLSDMFNTKGEFQICPRMDFDHILYVEYLRYNNYKNEIISFLKGC